MEITLYGSNLSANYRKALAVSKELGIQLIEREVNVYAGAGQTADFLATNPLGQIPVLEHENMTLTESNAIALYLVSLMKSHPLAAQDDREHAIILQWLFWESSQWQPMLAEVMGVQVGHRLLPSIIPAPESPVDWSNPKCVKLLAYLENALTDTWLVSGRLTVADFVVMGMTTYFNACQFPFESYPNIAKWCEQIQQRKAWQATLNSLWR